MESKQPRECWALEMLALLRNLLRLARWLAKSNRPTRLQAVWVMLGLRLIRCRCSADVFRRIVRIKRLKNLYYIINKTHEYLDFHLQERALKPRKLLNYIKAYKLITFTHIAPEERTQNDTLQLLRPHESIANPFISATRNRTSVVMNCYVMSLSVNHLSDWDVQDAAHRVSCKYFQLTWSNEKNFYLPLIIAKNPMKVRMPRAGTLQKPKIPSILQTILLMMEQLTSPESLH